MRQELPGAAEGKRRIFRRLGYETQAAAQADLDRVRGLLALAHDKTDADAIAGMLMALTAKEPLPSIDALKRKLQTGQDLTENITVGEWLDRWMKQETHRKATEVSYASHIRLYLNPTIGHIRVDRLTVGQVVDMFNAICDNNDRIEANNADRRALEQRIRETSNRREKRRLRDELTALPPYRRPVGPVSRQRIRGTLRAAINDAIVQQFATFNPAAYVQIPAKKAKPIIWTAERVAQWQRTGERPGPVMVWTPQQAGAFLDYVAEHDPGYEAMWHLMVFRGPRRGEVAGLPWTEVDLDAGTVRIITQLTEVDYEVIEGDPKSAAGERTIPLDEAAVKLLRKHRARQGKERLRLGGAWVDTGRVFTRADGSLLRPSWISDQFERLATAAGLPPLRLHDLRHTAATLMLAAKVDLKVIQETLGHSQLQTTSDLYTSVLPDVAKTAAEATVALVPRAPRERSGTHRAPRP